MRLEVCRGIVHNDMVSQQAWSVFLATAPDGSVFYMTRSERSERRVEERDEAVLATVALRRLHRL